MHAILMRIVYLEQKLIEINWVVMSRNADMKILQTSKRMRGND